jgi:hypothetical protein
MSETLMLGVTYIVSWVAGPGACEKCLALNGKEWTVDNLDVVPLIHDLSSHPNCKCEMDVEITVDPAEFQVWSA